MSGIPTATINIPTPASISHIEFLRQIVENISNQLTSIDREVSTLSGKLNGEDSEMKQVSENIHEIKQRSELTLNILTDLTSSDDKSQRVNSSFTGSAGETLRKIGKWVSLIDELEGELRAGEYDYYRIVADLLIDVKEQTSLFISYRAIPYVSNIMIKVEAIENELRRQVQWSFREIGELVSSDPDLNPNAQPSINLDMNNLNQIYLVIDVLGKSFRVDLLDRFAQLQLIPYEKAFKFGTKYCGLESLEKRYIWFRYLLKIYEGKLGGAFPKKWCVQYHFFIEFSRRTKKHLGDFLEAHSREEVDPQQYVSATLVSLKSILSFEAEIKAAFDVQTRGEDESDRIVDIHESIAEAFDPYLGPYVTVERETLDAMMQKLQDEEIREMMQPPAPGASIPKGPFDSSRQMFEYIKSSLKRCTAFSTGITYLSLSREYRICLHNYAESLKFRCPSPKRAVAGKAPIYDVNAADEVSMCRIICTGEYCIDTVPALEGKMKEHIKEEYKDEIDFSGQAEAFNDMISFTMGILIIGIGERLDKRFDEMRDVKWASVDNVGDVSKYMKDLTTVLTNTIKRIRANMSKAYFQTFVVKLATIVLDKYLENIWKLKRISPAGGGQLLLDLDGLKTFLVTMPQKGLNPPESEAFASSKPYLSLVKTKIAKIEVILKLVCVDDENMKDTFAALWPKARKWIMMQSWT